MTQEKNYLLSENGSGEDRVWSNVPQQMRTIAGEQDYEKHSNRREIKAVTDKVYFRELLQLKQCREKNLSFK